ncbi:unnamed protein product [Sympodiomycopsis kandeliae]
MTDSEAPSCSSASQPRKRFSKSSDTGDNGRSSSEEQRAASASTAPRSRLTGGNAVPSDILEDKALNTANAAIMPPIHDFETHKTINRIRNHDAICVVFQQPEGLTLWATGIADLTHQLTEATAAIVGDVTLSHLLCR